MNVLIWAGIFLVLTIIAGIFGFKKTAPKGTQVAKILFFIFLVLFIVFLVFGALKMFFHPSVDVNLKLPGLNDLPNPFPGK